MHFIMTISFFSYTLYNFPSDRPPSKHGQLDHMSSVGDLQGLEHAMISSL